MHRTSRFSPFLQRLFYLKTKRSKTSQVFDAPIIISSSNSCVRNRQVSKRSWILSKFLRESVRENKSRILSKFGNSNWAETTCKLLVSVFNFNPYPGVDNFLEYPWIIPPQVPKHRANIQSKSINNDIPRSILTSNPSNYPRIIHFWNSWSLERISITNNPPRFESMEIHRPTVHPSLVILPSIAFYKSTINRARRDAWPRVERNESREIRGAVARSGVGERECRRSRAIYSNAGVRSQCWDLALDARWRVCAHAYHKRRGGREGRTRPCREGSEDATSRRKEMDGKEILLGEEERGL